MCQFTHSTRQSWRQDVFMEFFSSSAVSQCMLQSLGPDSRLLYFHMINIIAGLLGLRFVMLLWLKLYLTLHVLVLFYKKIILLYFLSSWFTIAWRNMKIRFIIYIHSNQRCCTIHFIAPCLSLHELLDVEAAAVIWHLSLLWNDPSAGMSVCITGILSLILSSIPQMSKSASFTQASKAQPNFSPIWLCFPRGSVFSFESQPNRLWWRLCVLHESSTFHWEKIYMLCSSSYDIKWENTQTWNHSSCHERNGFLCRILLNYVELSILKAMSDIRSYKSSQCKPRTWVRKQNVHWILAMMLYKSHDTYSSSLP